jgi:hypothetical protein
LDRESCDATPTRFDDKDIESSMCSAFGREPRSAPTEKYIGIHPRHGNTFVSEVRTVGRCAYSLVLGERYGVSTTLMHPSCLSRNI